jgi:RNA polymerase sigma-70 factor, ECF subfamily
MALLCDRDLQAGFRDGHAEALEAVYRAHVNEVVRAARAVLSSRAGKATGGFDAIASGLADVVQEVFAKAFAPEVRRRFDARRSFAPYLIQIARNVAIDHVRTRRRNVPVDVEQLAERLALESETNGRQRDDWADPAMVFVVDRYVASLTGDERGIHDALYIRGLSQREAAAQLGIGRQVIRTVEAKLRAGLRRKLVEAGYLDTGPADADVREVRNRR